MKQSKISKGHNEYLKSLRKEKIKSPIGIPKTQMIFITENNFPYFSHIS